MKSLDFLRRALAENDPDDRGPSDAPRRAAVAVLLALIDGAPSICLIRRAKWSGDPWSEHIALPGGARVGAERAIDTLRRELDEEIGVALPVESELVGLPPLAILLAGREQRLLLEAFVHRWQGAAPALRCGPEVAAAFWLPVAELWRSRNLDLLALADGAETLLYPALRIPQGTIFGITLRVLTLLADQLGRPLPYLEEIPLLRRPRRKP